MDGKVIQEKQDFRWLSWSRIHNSPGTQGTFMKSVSDLDIKKIYYKLSDYDSVKGVVGHESINEIIADRLLTLIGFEHLNYQLIHADIIIDDAPVTTWICASEDFKEPGESKIALDDFYQAERLTGESPLEFCIRHGWEQYIWQMLTIDYLILNRDRHGANIEILQNPKKHTIRPAPLFDHGLSLVFSCRTESELKKFDVMGDKKVQCFVGSHSAAENLRLIPRERMPVLGPIRKEYKTYLLEGLDYAIGAPWRDKIWELIRMRWKAYEDLRNQK